MVNSKDIVGKYIVDLTNIESINMYHMRKYEDLVNGHKVTVIVKNEVPKDVGPFRFAIGILKPFDSGQMEEVLKTTVTWSIAGWQQMIDENKVFYLPYNE